MSVFTVATLTSPTANGFSIGLGIQQPKHVTHRSEGISTEKYQYLVDTPWAVLDKWDFRHFQVFTHVGVEFDDYVKCLLL